MVTPPRQRRPTPTRSSRWPSSSSPAAREAGRFALLESHSSFRRGLCGRSRPALVAFSSGSQEGSVPLCPSGSG
eukprot:3665196-Alexandrium_andersonii.AAC.1